VAGDVFGDAGQFGGFTDRLLEGTRVDVVAADGAGAGIGGEAVGGEDILPDPLPAGIGVLSFQGVGEVDRAIAGPEVLLVDQSDALEVFLEGLGEAVGEDSDAVLGPFPVADDDDVLVEVEILDAEADAFHKAEAGAVEEFGHQLVGAGEGGDDAEGFVVGEDGGEAAGSFCADGVEGEVEVDTEDLAVEEEDGAERLVLSGCGDAPFDGEVGEEGLDLGGTHLAGVAFVVEEDEPFDPGDVGLFGADGVVFTADRVSDLIEEAFGPLLR